jgi:hypothetical protein
LAAAKATGTVIPVHIYLYNHYDNPFGYNFNTTQQLQALVRSLDPRLVRIAAAITCR